MAAPGEVGGTVKLTVTYPGLDFDFPLIPVPNDGEVTRSATARIEDTISSAGRLLMRTRPARRARRRRRDVRH